MTAGVTPPPSGWDDDALTATLRANAGVGANDELSDDLRFRYNVVGLIRRRQARATEDTPCVFLLQPEGVPDLPDGHQRRVPMLDNGLTPLGGHFWFVGPVAAQGLGVCFGDRDDIQMFDYAAELGVGHVPAILYEPRTDPATARLYPKGLVSTEEYEKLRLSAQDVTLNEILAVVDNVHRECLASPAAQLAPQRLWKNAKQRLPVRNAEAVIQAQLFSALVGAFPSCKVIPENTRTTGRTDLEIEEPSYGDGESGVFVRHALLELKVLKSSTSTGTPWPEAKNLAALKEGVKQAAAYRDERGTRQAALCAFDMRPTYLGEACLQPVRTLLRRHRVVGRAWHVFASASEYRDHLVGSG